MKFRRGCVLGLVLAGMALGQSPSGSSTAGSGRVSCIVQIQRDSIGANIVKMSIQDPTYPVATLRSQIEELGLLTKGNVRGVQVTDDPIDPAKPESKIIRATFGIDGLVDRSGGWVRVGPIVKALTGAPSPHQLEYLQIDFDFENFSAKDLGNFSSPAVDLLERTVDRSLEYDVHIKDQNPSHIEIPDGPNNGPAIVPGKRTYRLDPAVLMVVAAAMIAAIALVYFLFLSKPSGVRKPR